MKPLKVLCVGDSKKSGLSHYLAAYSIISGIPVVFESIEDKILGYNIDVVYVDEFGEEKENSEQPTNPYFKKESWRKR